MRAAGRRFRQPLPLALLLAAGAAIGAGCGNWLAGLALTAVFEVLWLLPSFRHDCAPIMAVEASSPPAMSDRHMIRSRRLASSLNHLRDAASHFPDALVILDAQQRVRWFNPAAEQLLGLHWPQDRGKSLSERLHGTELVHWLSDESRDLLNNIGAPGQPSRQLHAYLLPFGHQQRLLLARDTSHLSRLEQVRRDFVANVSHELRTPLTVIHGYLELFDEDELAEYQQVIKEMRIQSKRMGQIVEDLLMLSRLETQDQVQNERITMSGLLATLHKEAQALSQGRHEITLEDHAQLDLIGSLKDLHSAFSNLISNAVRYTGTGGRITIRWERLERGAAYSVNDTGFGIAASHLNRLTERFYRVSSSRSRDSGGTGLGLSIVKHVLSLHQGRLDIQSTPGCGSTFTCKFNSERLLESHLAQPDEAG